MFYLEQNRENDLLKQRLLCIIGPFLRLAAWRFSSVVNYGNKAAS